MNPNLTNKFPIKIISIIVLVLFVVGLIINLFLLSRFTIKKTEPGTNPYPSSLGVLEVYFTKKLDAAYINNKVKKSGVASIVKTSFKGENSVRVDNNILIITFQSTPASGIHSIALKDIRSSSGQQFSKTIPLTIKNIPYENLSKRAKEIFDSEAAQAEEVPKDLEILNDLPHETNNYKITYDPIDEDDGNAALKLIITMKFFKPGIASAPASAEEMEEYRNQIRTYRTEALNWIKSRGYDLNNYVLTYTELEIRDEFPKGLSVD